MNLSPFAAFFCFIVDQIFCPIFAFTLSMFWNAPAAFLLVLVYTGYVGGILGGHVEKPLAFLKLFVALFHSEFAKRFQSSEIR